jgi:hypothetical protein
MQNPRAKTTELQSEKQKHIAKQSAQTFKSRILTKIISTAAPR